MNTEERIDNTIKVIYNILEKYKEKDEVKDAYEQAKKLKEKRKIK